MTTVEPPLHLVTSAVLELESHVNESGWDQPARLFALAKMSDVLEQEPALADAMDLDPQWANPDELIPVEQEWSLEEDSIDEALARITWPPQVIGTAITIERLLLPPSAEADLDNEAVMTEIVDQAMSHPDRREVRLAVAVLRDGRQMCAIRLRDKDSDDDVLTGPDLVPSLLEALRLTLT